MLEIVREIYGAWERGDFTSGPVHFHPDIRFESYMPDSAERYVAVGHGGIVDFMTEFLRAWRDYRLVGERFLDVGERTVLVEGYQSAVGQSSGAVVRDTVFSVWEFDGDLVVRLRFERDRDDALRAT